MQFNNLAELFRVVHYGTGEVKNINLPESGMLFACVIGGECEVRTRSTRVSYSKGTFFTRNLDRSIALFGDGKIAYFVASGTLCEQILTVNGVADTLAVSAAGASEDIFRMCELAKSADMDMSEAAFVFHRLIKNVSDARLVEERRRVDTALLIKEYIDCHAAGRLTLDEISKVFFISKTQIFRIYKSCFGIPPMQYFLQKKIEISKKMLGEENMRVSDVAEILGFSDSKHFSKTFKRYTGVLPREYRKEMRALGINNV